MNEKDVKTCFARFKKANPNPTTELIYRTHFELLIAVMLSAQSTDVRVNMVTQHLFQKANTAKAMLKLGEAGLKEAIQSIGLYNAKAKNIIKTCEILVSQHQGKVPSERASLEALPGVGRKTANVILNTAFGEHTIAVDTHLFRVANRTQMAPGKNVDMVEQKLLQVIPKAYHQHAHHWLILHGRYTCTARKPKCDTCLINDLCPYPMNTR